jgi:UDP-GlcNAc3NAcA epimerase
MIKISTLVGARPQFIKAAAISRVIKDEFSNLFSEIIIHTGQHYDKKMSDFFFDELDIPLPSHNMNISSSKHGEMTGRMIIEFERYLLENRTDYVLVYGDTNSTLAGMLAATKLGIPVVHVEAGLRSFNIKMPEEMNRILVDRLSTFLFCPTLQAVNNLSNEGINAGVHQVGDVMLDIALYYKDKAKIKSNVLLNHNLRPHDFYLATCHRQENTNNNDRLNQIFSAIAELADSNKVILPLHPRTKKYLEHNKILDLLKNVIVTEPLSFMDMIVLEQSAKAILTDSGGMQKEAFFYGVPCITMRDETEWVETVELGWNKIVGADKDKILNAANSLSYGESGASPYGDGLASRKILKILGK